MTPSIMWVSILCVGITIIVIVGIRIVRPIERGLIERWGRYHRFAAPGFHWIVPVMEQMIQRNITEMMVDASKQQIITNDNLNATVDAQVYYKVKQEEVSVKASTYNVDNYELQIVALARTTLRNIIGTMTLKSANSERGRINQALYETLSKEVDNWGIEIVRTELKEIDPPNDVQETMNRVVKAENEKVAAIDFATATETNADGQRRAAIKVAEGEKQAAILRAEGEAEAIRLVNEAANQYFVGNAQLLRRLETVERTLSQNSTVVLPADQPIVNVLGGLAGFPLPNGK